MRASATLSCQNCPNSVHARGRCHTCYVFWRRTGRERTEEQAIEANYAAFERAMFHELVRTAVRIVQQAS